MINILLVEDESNIRKIIAYDLKRLGYRISECDNGLEALTMAASEAFDVFIIDWMLPNISGIEVVKKLRETGNEAILIMLTARDEERDILYAFEQGVDDYINKPFSPKEVCARVQAHIKRAKKISPKNMIIGNVMLDQNQRQAIVGKNPLDLTKKEYELLEYFIKNQNIVCSRDQILNDIWGFDYDGDTRIVDVHVFKLRAKLIKANIHIQASRGIGYILKVENDD